MRDVSSTAADARGAVVAIGVFDGVHRGHRAVLDLVVREARERRLTPSVVTFSPHPASVLRPDAPPLEIEPLSLRLERFAEAGIEQVFVVAFDVDAAQEPAREFAQRVLVDTLFARLVVVGEDFHFGRDRAGNVEALRTWGAECNYDVQVVTLAGDDAKFSSTNVRNLLRDGDVEAAASILGHPVIVRGQVVHGDGRGGVELGYPTANISLPPSAVHPGSGIYAGAARTSDGRVWGAAVSVGRRPQFYVDGELLIEAHLLDFSGDLYGSDLDVALWRRLRSEQSFDSVEALIAQIGRDSAVAAELFQDFSTKDNFLLGFPLGQRR